MNESHLNFRRRNFHFCRDVRSKTDVKQQRDTTQRENGGTFLENSENSRFNNLHPSRNEKLWLRTPVLASGKKT